MNAHGGKTIRSASRARVGVGVGELGALVLTFALAALSYWLTVFPLVCVHIVRWRLRARRIPDPQLRHLALAALDKRGNIEGAAAFAAFVPAVQRIRATTALCAFQCAYNLLDLLGEQPSADPVTDGRRLHEALVYALDPGGTRSDWYEYHPQQEDGGYLDGIVEQCRAAFARLPAHELVGEPARRAAARIVAFQSLNLSEVQGDHEGLESWATDATPPGTDLRWWETAAAAGSSLGVYALLTAGAESDLDPSTVEAIERAYFPWIGCLHSLLDNLIDKREDEAAGHRSLIEYYSPERAAQRMSWLTAQAQLAARELPHGRRHAAIVAAMIANYLCTPEARGAQLLPVREAVLTTAGSLARLAMIVFAIRRLGGFKEGDKPQIAQPEAPPAIEGHVRQRIDSFR